MEVVTGEEWREVNGGEAPVLPPPGPSNGPEVARYRRYLATGPNGDDEVFEFNRWKLAVAHAESLGLG
jgi:hypothetical protein